MSNQDMTIAQVAETLGVSTRTVRRYIKSGRIEAELVTGPFGEEYRIAELPPDMAKGTTAKASEKTPSQTSRQTSVQTPAQVVDLIKELQEKNLTLAARLGAATERIHSLEGQLKMLAAPKESKSWWRRLFSSGD